MGPLHQNKGFKRELEQKWGIFKKRKVEVLANFSIHFGENLGKCAGRCQLWHVRTRQPLRIEAKVSQFWKLHSQDYNIHSKWEKNFSKTLTPPAPLLTLEVGFIWCSYKNVMQEFWKFKFLSSCPVAPRGRFKNRRNPKHEPPPPWTPIYP